MASHSRHTSSSSNYDTVHDHSGPVIKPKLESIETSSASASSNKSPVITDLLPPSNLSDIESVDDHKYNRHKRELRVVNPESTTSSHASDTTVAHPTPTNPKRSSSPAPSAQESVQTRDYQQTVGVKLSNLQDTSSLESLLAKPIHQQPANLSKVLNRESVFSNISQYSGKVELSAQAVPVVLQRSDSTKVKKVRNEKTSKSLGDVDHADNKDDSRSVSTVELIDTSHILGTGTTPNRNSPHNNEEEEESDYDGSSILMGKLPTTNPSDNMQLNPDKTFETNVEGAIPARSPRRPTSMLPPPVGIHSHDILGNASATDKAARRRTMHITTDLDQLMQDASSMSTFTSGNHHSEPVALQLEDRHGGDGDDVAVFDTTGPHDDDGASDAESHGPEVPSHRYSTGTSSTKMTPLLKTLAVEDEDLDEDEHSGNGNESDLITISKRETSLPPRPSEENIRKARNVSANIKKQQEEGGALQAGAPISDKGQYYVDDENPGFADDDDGYYDIDEPIQHPSRGKSVKNSIRRPTRAITEPTANTSADPQVRDLAKKQKRKSKERSKHHHNHNKQGKRGSSSVMGAASDLKPFSYKTLVSLLESMNGTIIGEEFSSLNIPIREKQLIEKIIDSLSRLSSDMILDQERYDIGLQRLEKALRVLEGFN